MRKYIILLLLLFLSTVNFAQFNISTPQSYEFQRYGNIPVNLSVGAIDLSLPVFNDKSLDISLQYNSSGFIPIKKSNYVGLNWFLNFGGSITRETMDRDDDCTENVSVVGFLSYIRENNISDESLYSTNIDRYPYFNGKKAELTSDKYSFNFMGINGYFYINAKGEPILVSNDPNLKIDISKLALQPERDCTPKPSEIIITDGKGNQYFFGGDYNNLEVSYDLGRTISKRYYGANVSYDPSKPYVVPQFYSIKSWLLTNVQFADGRYIKINYKKYGNKEYIGYRDMGRFCTEWNSIPGIYAVEKSFFDLNMIAIQSIARNDFNYDFSAGGEHIWGSGASYSWASPFYQINLVKKTFPEEIETQEGIIKFEYDKLSSSYEKGYDLMMLKTLDISSKIGNSAKQIKFNYDRTRDYIFLKELLIQDQKYIFEYYDRTNLPPSDTFGVDHWGYWNGRSDTENNLIPSYSFNSDTGDYKILGQERDPSFSVFDATLLRRITYPTGGRTSFVYEPHSYSLKIDRNSSSKFLRTLVSENGIIGGARVAKIIDIDNDTTNIITRDFKYLNNNDQSSGISLDYIRYLYYGEYKNVTDKINHDVIESSSNYTNSSLSSSPIEYERVLEYKNSKLYKEYLFSSYKSDPDSLSYKFENDFSFLFKPKDMNKNLYTKYSDFGNRRRRTLKEIFYKDGIDTLRELSYHYFFPRKQSEISTNLNIFKKECSVSVEPTFAGIYLGTYYYLHYYNYPLLYSIEEKNLLNKKLVSTNENRYYKESLDLLTKRNTFPDHSYQESTYQYAQEKSNQYLIDKNMVDIPLQTTITKTANGVTKYLSDTETKYPTNQSDANTKTNGLPLPYEVLSKDLQNSSTWNKEMTYTKYDPTNGNLQEYRIKDLIPIAIIWGYKQTQPIAKIEGAKYDDIKALQTIIDAVSASDSDIDQTSENILIDKLDLLRKDSSLANYQITTYTHNPLIGVTSITPPSGLREIYKYDSANRLEKIVDVNGNILKEHKYSYAPTKYYSSLLQQEFKKDNGCPLGYEPSGYLYTVPEGKYTSYVSQADADQQAQNDLMTNGQALANTNGTCNRIMCTISGGRDVVSNYSIFSYETPTKINLNLGLSFPELNQTLVNKTLYIGKMCSEYTPTQNRDIYIGSERCTISITNQGEVYIMFYSTPSSRFLNLILSYNK